MVKLLLAIAALAVTGSAASEAASRVIHGTYFVELDKGAVRPNIQENIPPTMTNTKA